MKAKAMSAYAALLSLPLVTYWVVQHFAAASIAPPPAEGARTFSLDGGHDISLLARALLAIAVVALTGRVLGWLFHYLQQPAVIGDICAGILLGPSLLGALSPPTMNAVMPQAIMPMLAFTAQLGVTVYMFTVGLSTDHGAIRTQGKTAIAVSHASIVVPFSIGLVLAVPAYQRFATSDVPFGAYALFMGISLSITAFPVLARILDNRRMRHTQLGILALTCAAADDFTAWLLLAFVIAVAKTEPSAALWTLLWATAFVFSMWFVVRPALANYIQRAERDEDSRRVAGGVLIGGMLACAVIAELIGIHAIFGGFFFGCCVPHASNVAKDLRRGLEPLVSAVHLPCFFAFSGMRTQIGLVNGVEAWLFVALVIAAATVGKFAGATLAARLTGADWRMAASLGALMNTRGLMELVVLNIGLEMRVLSPPMFTIGVLMAIATTLMTGPLLTLIGRLGRSHQTSDEVLQSN